MKSITYFFLFIASLLLFFVLSLGGFLYRVFVVRKDYPDYFFGCASTLSHSTNYYGADLWNRILIRPAYTVFGNRDESMSGVLGKNKRANTLTNLGEGVVYILNKIDPNHTEKSIEEDEQ